MDGDLQSVKLSNGVTMPIFGLGTFMSPPEEMKSALRTAIKSGYRMIDTAYNYLNEDAIGEVLEESIKAGQLKREDFFVTTKLGNIYTRPDDVKHSMSESLRKLRLDYVDLYLIHAPMAFKNTGDPNNVFPVDAEGKLLGDHSVDMPVICEVWKKLEELVDEGKAKSIGISNFNSVQVDTICKMARIKPVVNQVECHLYFPQYQLEKFCAERGIKLMAYGPLGNPGLAKFTLFKVRTEEHIAPLEDKTIVGLAEKYSKTPAQILLRNLVQRGIIVIPKSVTASRIESNIQVFDFTLTAEDMKAIEDRNNNTRLFDDSVLKPFKTYPYQSDIPF